MLRIHQHWAPPSLSLSLSLCTSSEPGKSKVDLGHDQLRPMYNSLDFDDECCRCSPICVLIFRTTITASMQMDHPRPFFVLVISSSGYILLLVMMAVVIMVMTIMMMMVAVVGMAALGPSLVAAAVVAVATLMAASVAVLVGVEGGCCGCHLGRSPHVGGHAGRCECRHSYFGFCNGHCHVVVVIAVTAVVAAAAAAASDSRRRRH